MISKKLGSHFSYDFVDVIKINPMTVQSFDLKNKSLIFTSVNAVQSFFQNGQLALTGESSFAILPSEAELAKEEFL